MGKVTALEKERRIFIVQGWIIEGVQDRLIVKNICDQWGLQVRQAQRYVEVAYTNWKKIEGVSIDMKREMKIAKLQQLIRTLKETYKGTPAGVRAIVLVEKEISKIEGIYPDKVVVLKGDPESPIVVTEGFSKEKEKRLADLLAKAAKIGK